MKLKKKKKKHMKSKYEKTKKLGTPASPTTTLKQRKTQKRKKLFVAQARSQGITVSRTVDAELLYWLRHVVNGRYGQW